VCHNASLFLLMIILLDVMQVTEDDIFFSCVRLLHLITTGIYNLTVALEMMVCQMISERPIKSLFYL
jgi:hypothetical protein